MPDEATGKDMGDGTDLDIKNKNLNPVIPLPEGIGLTAVAGADLPQEDIGDALQIFRVLCCIWKADGFDSLSPQIKTKAIETLSVMKFLLTAAAFTERSGIGWMMRIQDVLKKGEGIKSKKKFQPRKRRKSVLKQKLQDNIAEKIISKNGAPITVSEHDAIVAQVKRETAESSCCSAGVQRLMVKMYVLSKNQKADAVRTEPIYVDSNGQVLWRLKSYSEKSEILLQGTKGSGVQHNLHCRANES
nr:Zinc-finger domain of monoamine-oxidase A repressor R1 [Ipomoea batatas]